jgi:hypothetical protein
MKKTLLIACLLTVFFGVIQGYLGPYAVFIWYRDHGEFLNWQSAQQATPFIPGWDIAYRLSGNAIQPADAWMNARHRIAFWNGVAYLPLGFILGLGVAFIRRLFGRIANSTVWIERNGNRITALAGNAITLYLIALIGSAIVYISLNRSPLTGCLLATLLGSPIIAGFQIFAILRTRASDIGGVWRVVVLTANIIGLLITLFLMAIVIFFLLMGPIGNPG